MFVYRYAGSRIATCYDVCAHTLFSAICIAAAVAFYLKLMCRYPFPAASGA
jgi:hypothetical protein